MAAVIVTFNPPEGMADRARSIRAQADSLMIIDNASGETGLKLVHEAAESTGALLVENAENLGIAAALNQAATLAVKQGAKWLLTFDQDSRPLEKMVECMHAAIRAYPVPAQVGIVAPRYLKNGELLLKPDRNVSGLERRPIRTTMTSGNLVNLEAWRRCGGFDESFFMDYVDHDFCLRIRRTGFVVIEAASARLEHELGNIRRHRFGPIMVSPSNHNVLRRYYITRNRLITWGRHVAFDPTWVFGDVRQSISEFVKILFLEDETTAKLAAIARGLVDALRGKMGKKQSPGAASLLR